MHDPIHDLVTRQESVLVEGRVAALCNMTAWSPVNGAYLWEVLAREYNLVRVFAPEHGLFAELQDQLPQDSSAYRDLLGAVDFVSLYGETEDTLAVPASQLEDLDVLVVDLQDVGSRYYTFATTLSYVFDRLAEIGKKIALWVLDRPNPCGRYVEGTPLPEEYASFVGRPGMPHRHGLTMAELARYFIDDSGAKVELYMAPHPRAFAGEDWGTGIAPSPNMPHVSTARVYPGGCLLEGSNLSEGRGTTRPFETLGAPFLRSHVESGDVPRAKGVTMRPLRFVPTFHKHAGELCYGWQLHSDDESYASLRHTLALLRWIRASCSDFAWREDEYEFRSDRPAIELLAGDPVLLGYLNGAVGDAELNARLVEGENAWIDRVARYRIYDAPLIDLTSEAS